MAKALVEIPLSDGESPTILVESTASEGSAAYIDAAADAGVVVKAERSLTDALTSLGPVVDIVLRQLNAVVQKPKTTVFELGIKFGAKGNIIVAAGEAEANCKITLTWDLAETTS
jgi:hypothetical protein